MTTVFTNAEEVLAAQGNPLGSSDWLTIDQQRIDLFANATGDHQWIHVDPDKAAAGPFGCTVAHGYLTLSLVNMFLPEIVRVDGARMGVNYGCDRVRFPAPVKVGSRVRGSGELVKVEPLDAGVQMTVRVTVEIEGNDRPGCVVDTISRFYF